MRDRGTLLAGAGIIAAVLVAGIVLVYLRAGQAVRESMEAAERARLDEENQRDQQFKRLDLRPGDKPVDLRAKPDASLRSSVAYLVKQQSPDGAWRSDLYATFKDGAALTPLVIVALQEVGDSNSSAAIRKGCEYLAKLIKPDGTTEGGEGALDYPTYTAALAVQALSHPDQKDLLKLGWKPEDKQYGGWGYCRLIPKKPEPNTVAPPLIESNLSATVFALEALKAAGVKDKDVFEKAMVFVKRCQNYMGPGEESALGKQKTRPLVETITDGGFHFIYDDPVRNKAGAVEEPKLKSFHFHSYGSATADGLRCLLIDTQKQDFQILGATQWLEKNFRPDTHPGKYIPAHEPNREAVYYYYAASVSKALRAAKVKDAGGRPWAESLAAELVKRQKPDGSWANPVELVRENEPLVATANAVIALANCRDALSGK